MKIGRHTYVIKKGDKFLDNGSCMQLLTQSKENSDWGHTPHPSLGKNRMKEVYQLPNFIKYPSPNHSNCFIIEVL